LSSTYSSFSSVERIFEWKKAQYSGVVSSMPSYPGKILGQLVLPRFNDAGRGTGGDSPPPLRYIPDLSGTIPAQLSSLHYFRENNNYEFKGGVLLLSWDDYVEGHAMAPQVANSLENSFSSLNTFDKAWCEYNNVSYNPSLTCPSGAFVSYGNPRS
jgi:hypothetical protein